MIRLVSVSQENKYKLYERMTVICRIKINLKVTVKNYTYSGSVAKNRTQEERTVRVRTCIIRNLNFENTAT